MKRRIRNSVVILLTSVLLGALFLTFIYALPVKSARKHVSDSVSVMVPDEENENESAFSQRVRELNDSFTNALMVQNALEKIDGESALKHAMYVWHHDLGDDTTWLTEESLKRFLKNGTDGMYLKEYSKYWHGYLLWLKPLLMLMSWKNAQIFIAFIQMILMAAVIAVSFLKKNAGAGISVLIAFLFMKPLGIWFSLTLSVCWSIAMTAALMIFLFYRKMDEKNLQEEFFLLIGIFTSYFDFLTYPIVTLGIPVGVFLICDMGKESGVIKKIGRYFWICLCWVGGYIGMWGMKWVTAELLYRTGTLRNAVWSVIYRTTPLDGYKSGFSGIPRTWRAILDQYDSLAYSVGLWILIAAAVLSVLFCAVKTRNKNWAATVGVFLAVLLFPFLWFSLTQNHTAIHCGFTFRIMGVSIMALCGITAVSVQTIRTNRLMDRK